ncbi:MAG: hypothetical protein ACK6D5_09065, partial [Planctomyces sp.]
NLFVGTVTPTTLQAAGVRFGVLTPWHVPKRFKAWQMPEVDADIDTEFVAPFSRCKFDAVKLRLLGFYRVDALSLRELGRDTLHDAASNSSKSGGINHFAEKPVAR